MYNRIEILKSFIIKPANQYFQKKYKIHRFFFLEALDEGVTYIVSTYFHKIHVYTFDELFSTHLIRLGEEELQVEKENNMNKLTHLLEICSRMHVSMQEENNSTRVQFFDIQFYLIPWEERFYHQFYLELLIYLPNSKTLLQKKEDEEYQKFWQYIIQNEFHYLTDTFHQVTEYLTSFFESKMKTILTSFSEETLMMYHARETLYELKGRR